MGIWQLRRRYGPYAWSRTSQAFYSTLSLMIRPGDSILEFGSSTGHISFRMAREGSNVTLLDIRPETISEARAIFTKAGVAAQFIADDFLNHKHSYGLLWNSGLIQCLAAQERDTLLAHAASLSGRLLLFYPDTDRSSKVRGADSAKTPGVEDALEYSVADLPVIFGRYYDKVCWGRLPARTLAVPFDMFWLHGENTCALD